MNLDILSAQLVRKGFTESRAKVYAAEIKRVSDLYSVDPSYLLDNISQDFKLNDVGSFLINNALRFGYKTGKITKLTPNNYISRAIIK